MPPVQSQIETGGSVRPFKREQILLARNCFLIAPP
jgi:hypothetical protein